MHKTAPAHAACRGSLCQNCQPGLGLWEDRLHQPKLWHSSYVSRPSAAILLGFWRLLGFGLRIADSLCQHLAQLSLGLCGFPLGGMPLCHEPYVGMPERDLNPPLSAGYATRARARFPLRVPDD
jgi:hypothetical protein